LAQAGRSIVAHNLHKKLGPNQALAGLSASFGPGGIHGIIGPEGAGKTTLLRTLLGLLRPDEGRVEYRLGEAVEQLKALRSEIAYMPQSQSLYPDLSIEEHLEFFRDLFGVGEKEYTKRSRELLHITRLDQFRDRPAGKLSGGMYKKLGLMCSLLLSPAILLLDEPTNGVDPISRREFWELLYRLRSEGILVLVTTAYMDEAERCSTVHLVSRGKIIAEGEPATVLEVEKVKSFDELFLKKEGMA